MVMEILNFKNEVEMHNPFKDGVMIPLSFSKQSHRLAQLCLHLE